MIPPVLHYCWFGNTEKPKLAKKCIASWHRFCPEYEIIEWNEKNFDCDQHPYLRWCRDHQKWAFLSDFARLLILEEYGGIYLDTDVELLKSFDDLRRFDAFFGFEEDNYIATGLGCGAVPHHPAIQAMLEKYLFIQPDDSGGYPETACPAYNTAALIPFDLQLNGQRQTVCGAEILPTDWLNPYDDATGTLRKTENTHSIHWYAKSWIDLRAKIRSRLTRPFHRLFGKDCFEIFR